MNKLVVGVLAIAFLGVIMVAIPFASGLSGTGYVTGNQGQTNNANTANTNSKPTIGEAQFAPLVDGVQEVSVKALSTGQYDVKQVRLKKGIPVKFSFSADKNSGCGKALYIPDFNVQLISRNAETVSATFTPTTEGVFAYRCGMNMFRGQLIVGEATTVTQIADDSNSGASSCGKSGGCGCGGF